MEIVITGSSGLIGSEAVEYFAERGHDIQGIDNNMRADFFGSQGDTSWRLAQLLSKVKRFTHHGLDIRNRTAVLQFFSNRRTGAVIHCAAQPSHDLAKEQGLWRRPKRIAAGRAANAMGLCRPYVS